MTHKVLINHMNNYKDQNKLEVLYYNFNSIIVLNTIHILIICIGILLLTIKLIYMVQHNHEAQVNHQKPLATFIKP